MRKVQHKPRVFNDGKIEVYKLNEKTERYEFCFSCFANINKHGTGGEYLIAGAVKDKVSYIFKVRYFTKTVAIWREVQKYRIKYNNKFFNVVDYDDFLNQHKEIRLLGVAI